MVRFIGVNPGVCGWLTSFTGLPVSAAIIAQFMTLGLGKEVTAGKLKEAATRIHHLGRAFLGKCGLSRKDDRLLKAYLNRLRPGGRPLPELGCDENELEQMKDEYYRLMGWSLETGLPTRERLREYDL